MKISTRGRYALRIMLDLAANDSGGYISLKDIAARQGITVKYLEQIMIALRKAGYLKSSRGSGGGYRLARPASGYTVGDILRATEGNLSPINCLEDDMNMCPRSMECPTLRFWAGLDRVIGEYVDSVTLEDLLREDTSDDSMKREGEDRDGKDKQEHN